MLTFAGGTVAPEDPKLLGLPLLLAVSDPAPTGTDEGSNIMRSRLFGVVAMAAVLLIAGAAVASTRGFGHGLSQADRLRALEQERTQALVDADAATARATMADDYQGINPAGATLSREDLLGAVSAGVLDFLVDSAASPITVRLYGNAAVLRYQRSFDLVVAGTHIAHKAWSTELWERRHGRWQIVWEQTTAIPNNQALFVESLKTTT
jgi:hypothetical protein